MDRSQTTRERIFIFIANAVKELGIYETSVKTERTFEKARVYICFAEQYALVNAKIVDAETKGV